MKTDGGNVENSEMFRMVGDFASTCVFVCVCVLLREEKCVRKHM